MITNQTNIKELSEEAIFDTNLENILLANQLVSEIGLLLPYILFKFIN